MEDIRREQFEGLRDIVRKDASRRPDVGGPGLHPTAGACAVGARKFLVTYTISLDTNDVALARAIAREIRGSKGVKAIAMLAHGRAQLSLNISDFQTRTISEVYAKVAKLAHAHKTAPIEGRVVGLIPEAACERESEWMRQLVQFDPAAKILERRLEHPLAWPDKA